MIYDATLKKLFQQPPNRLLSHSLGKDVVVARTLPTDLIRVENLHPDLLFETADGTLIHAELHGYGMEKFPVRSLIYAGLILRDYERWAEQIVFWIGPGKVGIAGGLDFPPALAYRYRVIDVREIDAEVLLEGGPIEESIFAVLCKLGDQRETVARILRRIGDLPVESQREAVAQLLILSGLRGLKTLVEEEAKRMPVSIDIHENEFLEDVWQQGLQEGRQEGRQEGSLAVAREFLLGQAEEKFGAISPEAGHRIEMAGLDELQAWGRRLIKAATVEEMFG